MTFSEPEIDPSAVFSISNLRENTCFKNIDKYNLYRWENKKKYIDTMNIMQDSKQSNFIWEICCIWHLS